LNQKPHPHPILSFHPPGFFVDIHDFVFYFSANITLIIVLILDIQGIFDSITTFANNA
jgi:hypothetical protein